MSQLVRSEGKHTTQNAHCAMVSDTCDTASVTGFWKLLPVKVNRQPVCPRHVRIERKIPNILAGGDVGMSKRTI